MHHLSQENKKKFVFPRYGLFVDTPLASHLATSHQPQLVLATAANGQVEEKAGDKQARKGERKKKNKWDKAYMCYCLWSSAITPHTIAHQ